MQFTWLFDKNGKEIWEGDIVERRKQKWDGRWDNRGSIWFDTDTWSFAIYHTPEVLSILYAYETFVEDCKVIWNIYENPDLLLQ